MRFPDEIFLAYLRPLYTPYRTALPDPTVLPLEDDILWGDFLGGVKDTAIILTDDFEDPQLKFLGGGNREWQSSVTIYVMTIWTNEGKPPYLKEFAKFFEKYLVVTQPVSSLRTAGIAEFIPTRFVISQGPPPFRSIGPISQTVQNPQTDLWSLYINLRLKYYAAASAPPP